ncbi:enoyl-CoA-hydratase DpgB [Actinoplanes sp. L3-i22]|uniref:enoyl-CoA-hydratase DpgB n=1 Tax=Actinoplanes sp. L3-i22 TaxID=2836373 RepID=UPI001C85F97A|nr:enoyl-CoA-hydratase DpgB [Actinoplanes sp. L3-i22]
MDLAPVVDGLALTVDIDCARPLEDLTVMLNEVCTQVEGGTERTVVVLRLYGTSATGREWPGDVSVRLVNRWERAVRRLERLSAVNIAVATGTCGGPTLDVLLAADFRIGGTDLQLMLPVNDGHFWPGMSLYRLVQHLGVARARQIVLWGVDIPAATATELGLVDQVTEDLVEAVHTAAVLTGRISDKELTVRRQLLLEAGSAEYEEALGAHLAACDRELRRLRAVGARVDERAPEVSQP